MVGVLTVNLARMKVAVLRHSLHGARLEQFSWGILFGLAGVAGTFWLSLLDVAGDLLPLVFALWALGWALGPTLFTGEDTTLRPEHFRSLPVTARQLATGLLGASFVGAPVAVSAAAFVALVIYGARLGLLPALVGVPALLLQLVFVVVLSRFVTSALRAFIQSQLSAALSSLITGAVTAFFVSGWAVFVAVDDMFADGLPRTAATILHALPSGWGLVAVDAVHSGQWPLALGALAGLAALTAALLLAWSVLLERRLTTRRVRTRLRRRRTTAPSRLFDSATGAVVHKELLTWSRDFTRATFLYFAFFYSAFLCLYPVTAGSRVALPLIGFFFVVTAAGTTGNLYGADGSALWLTLTRPDAARPDVRGRQLAWLLVVAPVALGTTLLPIAITGYGWALPGALTLVVAATGAGSGLLVLNSVYRLVPMTDPHKRGDDMFDHSVDWLQFMSLVIAIALLTVPAFGFVLLGARHGLAWLAWLGVPVALGTGALYHWSLGRLAYRRLAARGPELLTLMLHGPAAPDGGHAKLPLDAVLRTMSSGRRMLLYLAGLVGLLALFPQGLVPLGIKLSGGTDPVWFLALHLPGPWQWPTIATMITLGVSAWVITLRMYVSARLRARPPVSSRHEGSGPSAVGGRDAGHPPR